MRRGLPIAYACAELGIPLGPDGKRCCPFHADEHPSFRTWVDDADVPRWGCFPCGAKGDVYDLIGRIEETGFTASLARAQEMLDGMPAEWEGIGQELKREFDRKSAEDIVVAGMQRSLENLGWVGVALGLVQEEMPLDYREAVDEFIAMRWCIGLDDEGNTVIPHYDYSRQLTGLKFRQFAGDARWAMPGSKFDCLYGGWQPRSHRSLLLCEGESDTWWASMQGAATDVYGLPSGAGAFVPQWTDLQADLIVLAFDGDDPGREATRVWLANLEGKVPRIHVWQPPDGEDLRSAKPDLVGLFKKLIGY